MSKHYLTPNKMMSRNVVWYDSKGRLRRKGKEKLIDSRERELSRDLELWTEEGK